MAKLERPLFSDEATGRIGLAASFKKGAVWNSIVPQFHRVKSESTGSISARSAFKICTGLWRSLNAERKEECNDKAAAGWTGYQYFIGMCIKEGDKLFDVKPHHETHERAGSDEIFPSGKLSLRPSLDLASVGVNGKPTVESVGVFRCFSLPIWNDKANSDEELYYETRIPYRWDGVSNFIIPIQTSLSDIEDVGKKYKLQLAWESDDCGGIIPATSNNVEVEITVLAGRNSQHDSYCVAFEIDYDIDGEGNEIKHGDLISGRLRRIAASSDEVSNEVFIRHHIEVEQTVNKFFGLW